MQQHIGWLSAYLRMMHEDNWKDMRDRGVKQLGELSEQLKEFDPAEGSDEQL